MFAPANIPETSTVFLTQPAADTAVTRRWATIPADDRVERTAAALREHGFSVVRAADGAEAKRLVLDMLPEGAEVHQGASTTLEDLGITHEVTRSGRYDALQPRIWSMDRSTQAEDIRRLSAAPSYMLGSVHALTETGSAIIASNSGSQVGPYVSGAREVIWVVGTHKIVADIEEGMQRIEEYAFPLEDARAQVAYGINSAINKVLIMNSDRPGRTTIVLVDEVLGF